MLTNSLIRQFGSLFLSRIIELSNYYVLTNSLIRQFGMVISVTNFRIIELFIAHQFDNSIIRDSYSCHECSNSRISCAHQFANSLIWEFFYVTNFRIIELFIVHQFANSPIREFIPVTNFRIIELLCVHQFANSLIRDYYFCHEFSNCRIIMYSPIR